MTEQPQPHGWHWAQRGNKIEMVKVDRNLFAGKAWCPDERRQFEISDYSAWWPVPMPELENGSNDADNT